jgi:hypothetical protein
MVAAIIHMARKFIDLAQDRDLDRKGTVRSKDAGVRSSGSGPVAAVTFKRRGAGVATLTVTHNELVDRQGIAIPSAAQNGAIIPAMVCYLPLILR